MNTHGKFTIALTLLMVSIFYSVSTYALPGNSFSEADFAELIELDLEEILKIKVDSPSSFTETPLTSSSSLSVVTAQQWNARGDRTLPDVISHASNTMVYPTLYGGHAYQVRGYGASSSARGSATILDGVPLNPLLIRTTAYYSNSPQLGVLDKIEVIRGPGSALYGSDAFHSVISYTTFKSKEKVFNVSLESGERGFYKSTVQYSQPINSDIYFNFAAGTNGQGKQNIENLYTDAITNEELLGNYDSELEDYSTVAKLFNNERNNLHFNFSIYQNNQKHNNHPGFGAFQNKGDRTLGNLDLSTMNMKTNVIALQLKSNHSDNITYGLDSYFWKLKGINAANVTRPSGEPSVFSVFRYLEQKKYGYHANVLKKIDHINTDLALKVGVDKTSIPTNDTETFEILTSTTISSRQPATMFTDEEKIYKATLETRTHFAERLLLTLGLGWVDYPTFGDHISPRLSMVFNPNQKTAYKLIYGGAFRAPDVFELTGTPAVIGNPELEPEVLDSLELVYMYHGNNWKTEIAAYTSKWKDGIAIAEIDSTELESRTKKYFSSARSESKGIEFNIEYIQDTWSISQEISYIESKNLSANEDYSAYPSWILNSNASYKHSDKLRFNISLKVFDNYYLGDKISAVDPSLIKRGSLHSRADIRIHKKLSQHSEAWLDINNFFDHKNIHPSVWNAENGVPDTDRQISIGVKYLF